jgi:hypothetical protein
MLKASGANALTGIVMLRTRSFAVWQLAGVILVAVLVCGLSAAHQRKSQTSYLGKPLEYWFNQLPMTFTSGTGFSARVMQSDRMLLRSPSGAVRTYGGWMEKPEASAKAIRAIGTNALAFYLWKLTRHIGPIESKIHKVARAVGFQDFLFADVSPERGQAVTALILLKPLPPGVVSELVTLSTNGNREIAAAAHCALTTKVNDLVLLRSPDSKPSVDADLLKIRIPADFPETLGAVQATITTQDERRKR